jgi:5,5'-dehydrodivanillate O-demethylase oxygenase subunit
MAEPAIVRFTHRSQDCLRTGPGTPAGRYLRQFWQPVYHSVDLKPGSAVTIRIMSQDFTLYRGQSGQAHLIDGHCPHRGTRLSSGWIEGEELRCFYHGWKFAPDGRCVEQPAEENGFCDKVSIGAYPLREYLGLVFAFLGDGAPPDFQTHPEFEHFDGMVEIDSYSRDCNYFQNLENALDMSHIGFVHADNAAVFKGVGLGRALDAEESAWGVTYGFTRPDGQRRVQQFGMPNIFYLTALPTDPDVGWQESMFWWVPLDDTRHMQFSVHRVPAAGEVGARVHARRQARRTEIEIPHQTLALDILEGRASMRDVDKKKVDLVRLQDDVAQVGQGLIVGREGERLGRADIGVIAIRRLWEREMAAFLAGRPTKKWRRDASIVPRAWGLAGNPARIGGEGTGGASVAEVIDVRPHVEIAVQLKALHATVK